MEKQYIPCSSSPPPCCPHPQLWASLQFTMVWPWMASKKKGRAREWERVRDRARVGRESSNWRSNRVFFTSSCQFSKYFLVILLYARCVVDLWWCKWIRELIHYLGVHRLVRELDKCIFDYYQADSGKGCYVDNKNEWMFTEFKEEAPKEDRLCSLHFANCVQGIASSQDPVSSSVNGDNNVYLWGLPWGYRHGGLDA